MRGNEPSQQMMIFFEAGKPVREKVGEVGVKGATDSMIGGLEGVVGAVECVSSDD